MSLSGSVTRVDMKFNDNTPNKQSKPLDSVVLAAYHHDLEYAKLSDTAQRNTADRVLLNELDLINNPSVREKI